MKALTNHHLPQVSRPLTFLCLLTMTLTSGQINAQEPTTVGTPPVLAEKNLPPFPPISTTALKPALPENAVTQPRAGVQTLEDSDWTIQITPQASHRVDVNPKDYEKIYSSIPYRRSEYLANPSYRHDTTVEILFGQMRPTVVHKQDTPQRIVNPRPDELNPGFYGALQYWTNPGRFIQVVPGLGPFVAPMLY